ncbi:MAG TPA: RHS repeat-associated core domain-containing protein, partial [Caldisericia bacterium]|nr:RHS repeat-associated core domain-containing protein [Caldisericia bacterium]
MNTAIQWVQSILPESSVFNDLKLKTSFTNGQNETMSFGYDSLKRLTSITFSDLSTVSYTYDNENNMVSTMTDTHGIHNFSYDLSGRMTQYTAPYNWSVNLTFGDSGFLTQRVNNNGTYSYTYDNNSLVEFDTPELADPIEYQWRANGQIESKTIPATDDIKYEWTVNGIGQATEVTVDYGTTEKYSWDYTFDTNGRKSQIVDAQGTRNISYDAMGQVTSVVENGTSTGIGYDSTYNMTSKSVGTDNYVYSYNADDQLTMIYENGLPTTEFEYDSAGRLTSRHPPSVMTYNYRYDYYRDRNNPNIKPYSVFTSDETTYEYNDLGNLTKVVKPNDDEISFTYYGNGKRATKSVKVGLATTTWRYYYDQDLPVKIENLSDSTENVTFTFNGSRDLLTMNYKNNTYFYIINIRGDVEAILDTNGNEVASYSYGVWGVPTITNPNSLPNPFLYQGAYGNIWDSEIELYYMNARHYDPSIGRFITQDREHGTLTNTMSQNLYIYCYNNPYAFTDSSGFAVDPGIGGPSPMTKDDLTAEQRELYEWLEEYDDYSGTIEEFLDLWDKSQDVADRMQKYDNDEENKYDFKIAFMACYWNDKGAVGLSGDSLISFANLMKGICYMETELGNLGHYKEGLFQVSTLKDLSTSGWISKKLYNDYNNKLGTNPNAGIFTGIAHWLKDYSGWAATGEDELDMNFNDFKAIKNKIHTKEIWK